MSENLRSFAILDYLKNKKYCSVQELLKYFHVSQATIHRDINFLVKRDLVQKLRGGIRLLDRSSVRENHYDISSMFQVRMDWNLDAKKLIAEQALNFIREGDIVFLDSSTTVRCLAEKLITSNIANLTIVTNSVSIMEKFYKYPAHFVLISLGGCYDRQLNSFIGQAAMRELENLSISKAFVSCFGVMDGDVTTNHEYHALLLNKVLSMAETNYLLADKSKINRRGIFKLPPLRSFENWITE